MTFYIVEDDANITLILKTIIKDCDLGTVIGSAVDGKTALYEINQLKPDILLVDLFIPGLDGISLVQKLDESITSIMISQVSSKDMIGRAYEAGINSFIQKPINAIEVQSVIRRVARNRKAQEKLKQIQSLFYSAEDENEKVSPSILIDEDPNENKILINSVLERIGILGETGACAILDVTIHLLEKPQSLNDMSLKLFFSQFSNHPKSYEQRIRRTASIALNNLACMGLEDYFDPTFQEFASVLYSFQDVRQEMNRLRKGEDSRGKVNIRKFLNGICHICYRLKQNA